MSTADLHLVLAVTDGVASYEAGPMSWDEAQAHWAQLDSDARNYGSSASYFQVRAYDDPKFTHLAPRLYPGLEAAAKALARRNAPGETSHKQHQALNLLLSGHYAQGWWRTGKAARDAGYLKGNHRWAYLTPLANSLDNRVNRKAGS